jgi:hypothetical protein
MHDDLYVTHTDPESGIMSLNNPRAPKFKKFIGAWGWLDPNGDQVSAKHWFVLGGIQADDRLLVLDETSGPLPELISSTIMLKDMFFVSESWADTTDIDLMMPIWEADGLTRYLSHGKDPVGRELWVTPSEKIPHFRSRSNAMIIHNIPPSLKASTYGGVSRLVALAKAGQMLVHSRCSIVQWVMDQPRPADVANHPVFHALNYLVYGNQRNRGDLVSGSTDIMTRNGPYKNLQKRR